MAFRNPEDTVFWLSAHNYRAENLRSLFGLVKAIVLLKWFQEKGKYLYEIVGRLILMGTRI